jgi:hypothetical protein
MGEIMWAASEYHRNKTPENLAKLEAVLEKHFAVPPDNACHWCGKTDTENDDEGYGPCVDITVRTADGEEGYAQVTRYACNDHLIEITGKLMALGFGEHRHGGINFLEPQDCPGYERMADCPTPASDD